MVFVKQSTFFLYVFFSKKSKNETFFYILDRKQCFLDLKSDVVAKSKNRHFAKGLVHGSCQKIDFFSYVFFLSKKCHKETFFDILDRKECFLDLKSEVLTKSKIIDILQRVFGFCQKMTFFSYRCFEQKKQQRNIFWYFE